LRGGEVNNSYRPTSGWNRPGLRPGGNAAGFYIRKYCKIRDIDTHKAGQAAQPQAVGRLREGKDSMKCDISKVDKMIQLFKVPNPRRDINWRNDFYNTVIDASFAAGNPQLIIGPDGFPYFSIFTPQPNVPFDSFCICNLLDKLINDGIGIAINPNNINVDWIFSYGDLISYRYLGSFEVDQTKLPPQEIHIPKGQAIVAGQPSEEYLPKIVRDNLRKFMETRLKIKHPGVFLFYKPGASRPDLVFSIFSDDYKNELMFRQIIKLISWYLPKHYPIIAIPKKSELANLFEPL
jgi:hypothetical protein